jgi:hypothetical protein
MEMIKKVLIILFITLLSMGFVAAAATQTVEYLTPSAHPKNANFLVRVLKYEPFPVNPGEWFDLWVKIENTGEEDAENLIVELQPSSFFTVQGSPQEYGRIPGTVSAYRDKPTGDTKMETNQVLLKFHVHADESAPAGTDIIKLRLSTDGGSSTLHDLPIDIAKTKTDFSVSINQITPQETSLTVSNIGELQASAVTISIKDQDDVTLLQNYAPVSLGALDSGDTSVVHMNLLPKENADTLTWLISYTDTADVRTTIEKIVSINKNALAALCPPPKDLSYLLWIYGAVGFICGAFLIILSVLLIQGHKKRRQK